MRIKIYKDKLTCIQCGYLLATDLNECCVVCGKDYLLTTKSGIITELEISKKQQRDMIGIYMFGSNMQYHPDKDAYIGNDGNIITRRYLENMDRRHLIKQRIL